MNIKYVSNKSFGFSLRSDKNCFHPPGLLCVNIYGWEINRMWLQARRRNRQKHLTLTHQHSTPFSLSWQPKGHYAEDKSNCYREMDVDVVTISLH